MNTKPLSIKCVLSIIILFISQQTHADTLVYANGKISGVDGLSLFDSIYNAKFVDGLLNSVYGSSPIFQNDADTITTTNVLLNSLANLAPNVAPSDYLGCDNNNFCALITPFDQIVYGNAVIQDGNNKYSWYSWSIDPTINNTFETYVVWEEAAVVPVPAAIWLFGSGLIGFIGMTRRKIV